MLKEAKKIEGFALHARDGVVGEVKDLYFDDHEWNIRYVVVVTGPWLKSRRVLISPEALHTPDWNLRLIPVDLTQEQVRNSPSINTDRPVSRQHEAELREYYGWPPYWGSVFVEGGIAGPILDQPPPAQTDGERPLKRKGDPHLRSAKDTTDYHIEAVDGSLGHVHDFLIDPDSWRIHYLVVDTRNWWPGKKVLVAPQWIHEISWDKARVVVDLTREAIKGSPPYDPHAPWSPEYGAQLHAHYGRPHEPSLEPSPRASGSDNPNRP